MGKFNSREYFTFVLYLNYFNNPNPNPQLNITFWKPKSGRVDKASATETIDLGLIPGRVKLKTIKIGTNSFPAWRSAIKRDNMKPLSCVVGSWEDGSLTQRPKGPFAVSWLRQLGE